MGKMRNHLISQVCLHMYVNETADKNEVRFPLLQVEFKLGFQKDLLNSSSFTLGNF